MSSPGGKSDDEGHFGGDEQFDDDKMWGYTPYVPDVEQSPMPPGPPPEKQTSEPGQVPWKRRREDDRPQTTAPQPTPWKRSRAYRPFAGDVAIVELRTKGLAPDRISDFHAPPSEWKYKIALGLAGVPMVAIFWIVGYELSSGPSLQLQYAPHSSQFNQSEPDKSAKLTVSAAPTDSKPRGFDPRTIATKMTHGVQLMTYGEITKARAIFQRVAEAGEGAGAFALAETYDPLVLEELRLREEIMPNIALAYTWYERARDLGSPDARDRISRLAKLP